MPPRILYARMAILVAVAAFMLFGPFYRQVLGGQNEIFRRWEMFKGKGESMCAATYTLREADGTERRIDVMETLGYGSWRSKKSIKKIRSGKDARRVSGKLCKALGSAGTVDLRLVLQCRGDRGWSTLDAGDENVCG